MKFNDSAVLRTLDRTPVGDERQSNSGAGLYVVALLLTVTLTLAVYPGFMSYDSFHALREARGSVRGGSYPPFVSYVWRMVEFISPSPALMMLLQNGLLLLALAHIARCLRLGMTRALILLFAVAFFPPLLGSMLVIWKDVAVGASFAVSLALAIHAAVTPRRRTRAILVFVGCCFVFFGMAYRFNAASAAPPLVLYLMWVLQEAEHRVSTPRALFRVAAVSSVVFLCMAAAVFLVNNFRIPSLERLAPNTGFHALKAYDLIGISRFSGVNLLPPAAQVNTQETINSVYDPRHLNITLADTSKINSAGLLLSPDIKDRWTVAVFSYPLAYLKHRLAVTRELIGFGTAQQFYPTHPMVDKNEYGIVQEPTDVTRGLSRYVTAGSDRLLFRPWMIYVLALASVIAVQFIARGSRLYLPLLTLFSSSLLYFLPMLVIMPAADLRYNFWALLGALLVIIVSAFALLESLPLRQASREMRHRPGSLARSG